MALKEYYLIPLILGSLGLMRLGEVYPGYGIEPVGLLILLVFSTYITVDMLRKQAARSRTGAT